MAFHHLYLSHKSNFTSQIPKEKKKMFCRSCYAYTTNNIATNKFLNVTCLSYGPVILEQTNYVRSSNPAEKEPEELQKGLSSGSKFNE